MESTVNHAYKFTCAYPPTAKRKIKRANKIPDIWNIIQKVNFQQKTRQSSLLYGCQHDPLIHRPEHSSLSQILTSSL
jgi:hypothetical protein